MNIRIVVLDRGFVAVGQLNLCGLECNLTKAFIVRRYGTSAGLGQLAKFGPRSETVLDPADKIYFPFTGMICSFECDEENWKKTIAEHHMVN